MAEGDSVVTAAGFATSLARSICAALPSPELLSAPRDTKDQKTPPSLADVLQPAFRGLLEGAVDPSNPRMISVELLLAPLIEAVRTMQSPLTTEAPGSEVISNKLAACLTPFLAKTLWPLPVQDSGANLVNGSPSRPNTRSSEQSQDTIDADIRELAKTEPSKTIIDTLRKAGLLDLNKALPASLAASSPYIPEKVAATLRLIAKRFVEQFGNSMSLIVRYVELEIVELAARSALAAAISTAVSRIEGARGSSMPAGRSVHAELQKRYVDHFQNTSDLVVERVNPATNREELFVTGPTTGRRLGGKWVARPLPLQEVAKDRMLDPTLKFLALRMAMAGTRLSEESWLRCDLVEFAPAPQIINQIWEIKPVSSLVMGVWQEATYRVTYNVIRMALASVMVNVRVAPNLLLSGTYWVLPEFTPVVNGTFQLLRPIHVGFGTAVPFQVDMLRGVIGYVVINLPQLAMEALIVAVAAAVERILAALRKAAEKLGQLVDEAVIAFQAFVQKFGALILTFVVILAALAAIVWLFPAATVLVFIEQAAAWLTIVGSQIGDKSVTAINIAGIRIAGVPVDDVPRLIAEITRQTNRIASKLTPMQA